MQYALNFVALSAKFMPASKSSFMKALRIKGSGNSVLSIVSVLVLKVDLCETVLTST